MHLTHLIIDDFFNDPHAIRNQALAMNFPPRPEGAIYPGRNADHQLALPGIEKLISQIVHEPLQPKAELSHCRPRIALAGDGAKTSVHIDNCHWSAIIYLTLDEHCQGGTHFFRHKATGWDMAPVFPGVAEAAGYKSAGDALDTILKEDENDLSKWEMRMTVPMKFNRLVLLRGYLWHDAGASFGDTPENGRLILPAFFQNVASG